MKLPFRVLIFIVLTLVATSWNSAYAAVGLEKSTAKLEDYHENIQDEIKRLAASVNNGNYAYRSELTKPASLEEFTPKMLNQLYRLVANSAAASTVGVADVTRITYAATQEDIKAWYLASGRVERRTEKVYHVIYMNAGLIENRPVSFLSYYIFNEDGTGLTLGYTDNKLPDGVL